MSNASDFIIENGVLRKYVGHGGDVVIPEGVTEIGKHAFADYASLGVVQFPDSLVYLDVNVFKGTDVVKRQSIYEGGCTYLGQFLISSDKDVTHINIRPGTVAICAHAFYQRSELQTVRFPSSLKVVGFRAFTSCYRLEEACFSPGLERIEESAFSWCTNLKNVYIPDSCAQISKSAFVSATEKKMFLPNVAYIPFTQLSDCVSAQADFFAACYLTCKEKHSAAAQELYDVYVTKRKSKLLTIMMDFWNMTGLQALAPVAITKTNIDDLVQRAQNANHTEMTAFLLDYKNRKFGQAKVSINAPTVAQMKLIWAFGNNSDGTLKLKSYKGTDTEIIVPQQIGKKAVTVLDDEVFSVFASGVTDAQVAHRRTIRQVVVPEGITQIGSMAFAGCKGITSIILPSSLTFIHKNVFFPANAVLSVPAGSYAEIYAKENNIPFVAE